MTLLFKGVIINTLIQKEGTKGMHFDDMTFDYEICCNMCGSNKYETEYNEEENCIIFTCLNCGNKDKLILEE